MRNWLESTKYYGQTKTVLSRKNVGYGLKKTAAGYTLVEVLAVVAILGILSSMGFAGLMGAAENARVNGTAKNITAFMDRMGKESKRLSTPLCLRKVSDQRINVYKSTDCTTSLDPTLLFDHMDIEAPMRFVSNCPNLDEVCNDSEDCNVNLLNGSNGVFSPRIGLSSLPISGFVCAQSGSNDHYAMALKSNAENFVKTLTYEDEEWSWLNQ